MVVRQGRRRLRTSGIRGFQRHGHPDRRHRLRRPPGRARRRRRDRPLLRRRTRRADRPGHAADRPRLPLRRRRRSASSTSSARSPSSAATRRTSPTRGPPTRVEIGDHNVIREGVTINRGHREGRRRHPARQPQLPDGHLARRPRLQARRPHHDRQRLDARRPRPRRVVREHLRRRRGPPLTSTIGGYSFVGGQSRIVHDVPRYMLVDGNPSQVRCINIVGLKRNGISPEGIDVPARGPSADLPRQDERAARGRDPRNRTATSRPRSGACSTSSSRSRKASTAGPGNAGGTVMTSVASRRWSASGTSGSITRGSWRRSPASSSSASPTPGSSRPARSPSGTAPQRSTDYRELLDQVDAVSVAVPTALHREVAGAFLDRGIATMIEKPLATTLAEAEELVALARERRGDCSRSATSSGSTRRSRHSTGCTFAPSTSPPSGSRRTRSARPTSASCST